MKEYMSVKVRNMDDYAYNHRYIVARSWKGELWFYGAWDEYERALEVANELNGIVVENLEVC